MSNRRLFGTQLYTLGLSCIADPGVLLNSAARPCTVACSTALPRSPFTSNNRAKMALKFKPEALFKGAGAKAKPAAKKAVAGAKKVPNCV